MADYWGALAESLSINLFRFFSSCDFSMICRFLTPNPALVLRDAEYLSTPS